MSDFLITMYTHISAINSVTMSSGLVKTVVLHLQNMAEISMFFTRFAAAIVSPSRWEREGEAIQQIRR